jgi:hypothetical protein
MLVWRLSADRPDDDSPGSQRLKAVRLYSASGLRVAGALLRRQYAGLRAENTGQAKTDTSGLLLRAFCGMPSIFIQTLDL